VAVPGKGLIDGLKVTAKTLSRRSVTEQYPDVQPELPPRTRGVIALMEENCTSCMLCARECPSWCIYIDSHTETAPSVGEQARERSRNVLDRFAIDFSLCMYCGICIEACPFDALFWSPEFEYAETELRNLTHEKDRLRDWMWTVPAPQPIDPGPSVTEAAPIEAAPAETAPIEAPPADAAPGETGSVEGGGGE
jgi:NADH-quinone oxidoreductase subunit I